MAVDLVMSSYGDTNFSAKMEENAVQEAASGLESVEKLIRLLSHAQQNQQQEENYKAVADVAVTKFKKAISLMGRTRVGHARFRRAPLGSLPPPTVNQSQANQAADMEIHCPTPLQQIPSVSVAKSGVIERKDSLATINFSYSSTRNSFMSSLTGDTESTKQLSSSSAFQITNLSSVGKPPLSSTSSLKRKCSSETLGSGKYSGSSDRCHCSKKRKLRLKRVVRVPAISLKLSDIPPDDYSWRKYGQKPIKGSPHPRGYYKCSSLRGCPARKHVERALDDPSMLVVTYEGEHNHSLSVAETSNLILESS